MKLDKLQRHTAYIILLAEFKKQDHNEFGSWFCYLINDLFGIDDDGFVEGEGYNSIARVMNHFPELNKLMDERDPSHYDYKTRGKILKQCIAETYEP